MKQTKNILKTIQIKSISFNTMLYMMLLLKLNQYRKKYTKYTKMRNNVSKPMINKNKKKDFGHKNPYQNSKQINFGLKIEFKLNLLSFQFFFILLCISLFPFIIIPFFTNYNFHTS